MKLVIIIIVFVIGVVISLILSKINKRRLDRFMSFSEGIQAKIRSIQESELNDLRVEIKCLPTHSLIKYNISELTELPSSIRYTKKKIKRFYNPYTHKIEEFPDSKHIYLIDSESDIEITSIDLEQLITEKLEKQQSTGKIIPLKRKIG